MFRIWLKILELVVFQGALVEDLFASSLPVLVRMKTCKTSGFGGASEPAVLRSRRVLFVSLSQWTRRKVELRWGKAYQSILFSVEHDVICIGRSAALEDQHSLARTISSGWWWWYGVFKGFKNPKESSIEPLFRFHLDSLSLSLSRSLALSLSLSHSLSFSLARTTKVAWTLRETTRSEKKGEWVWLSQKASEWQLKAWCSTESISRKASQWCK